MPRVFIAVGSNVRPLEHVPRAVHALRLQLGPSPLRVSTFFRTMPLAGSRGPPFCNGVVEARTALPPRVLKDHVLRGIEAHHGRVRTADKAAPRTLDLDLLLHGDLALHAPGLVLPDPDIPRRPFLALPLHELAPDLVLPGSGLRVADLAARFRAAGDGGMPQGMTPLPRLTARLRAAAGVGAGADPRSGAGAFGTVPASE